MAQEAFSDREVRFGFIRKVYGILSAQLIFTCMFVFAVMNSESLQKSLLNGPLITTVFVLYFGTYCALACCGFDKKVPVNYFLLAVFTGCVSFMVSFICLAYPPIIVFEAAVLTAAVVVGLTIYAFTTKNDFTICGPLFFILGMILLTGSLFCMFVGPSGHLLYCCLGVFCFSFYLIIDTQMIMGGNRKYQIGEDSYILATLMLYMDIINMFLYILEILGSR